MRSVSQHQGRSRATTVPRKNNAVALVLDRSGSMGAAAGGTSTRSQLLVNAIGVFRDLMLAGDEVAVTTFDDLVDTPIPMQAAGGAPAFGTVDLSPRGLRWIGGGIQAVAAELAAATHANRSVIVLTDGNENIHPYIGELPAGTITNRTYAIGFGLPGDVSDQALNDITLNTGGDLIVTGNISTDEQRFMLTKYFVQVLAGVTNSQVVLDPEGKLYFGSKDAIPFKVADADVHVDAILVCPIPKLVESVLQTPGGDIVKPATVEPNVTWIDGAGPVLSDGASRDRLFWAEATLPDGSVQTLKLKPFAQGRYAADYATSLAGVYVFRVIAQGLTAGGSAWTREKTLTAGVFRKRGSGEGGGSRRRFRTRLRVVALRAQGA